MFGSFSKGAPPPPAILRISSWTRERFRLGAEDTVLVTEIACSLPGCPPLETVVAFWTGSGQRHQFKVFKAAQQVAQDDLPYSWMKTALAADEGFSCNC